MLPSKEAGTRKKKVETKPQNNSRERHYQRFQLLAIVQDKKYKLLQWAGNMISWYLPLCERRRAAKRKKQFLSNTIH